MGDPVSKPKLGTPKSCAVHSWGTSVDEWPLGCSMQGCRLSLLILDWGGTCLEAFEAAGFPSASGGMRIFLQSPSWPLLVSHWGFGVVYPLRETSGYRKDISAVLAS